MGSRRQKKGVNKIKKCCANIGVVVNRLYMNVVTTNVVLRTLGYKMVARSLVVFPPETSLQIVFCGKKK